MTTHIGWSKWRIPNDPSNHLTGWYTAVLEEPMVHPNEGGPPRICFTSMVLGRNADPPTRVFGHYPGDMFNLMDSPRLELYPEALAAVGHLDQDEVFDRVLAFEKQRAFDALMAYVGELVFPASNVGRD